jgi:hypothetical protein
MVMTVYKGYIEYQGSYCGAVFDGFDEFKPSGSSVSLENRVWAIGEKENYSMAEVGVNYVKVYRGDVKGVIFIPGDRLFSVFVEEGSGEPEGV